MEIITTRTFNIKLEEHELFTLINYIYFVARSIVLEAAKRGCEDWRIHIEDESATLVRLCRAYYGNDERYEELLAQLREIYEIHSKSNDQL